jgi:hypothetical protein
MDAACACGFARSIWDLGGIRRKAGGPSLALLAVPAAQSILLAHGAKRRHRQLREHEITRKQIIYNLLSNT